MSKYKLPLPPIPPDKDFIRDSFWWKYRQRFSMPMKFGWEIKPSAFKWFDLEEKKALLNNAPFPPKPIFRTPPKLPPIWDGRDERPGRVPNPMK